MFWRRTVAAACNVHLVHGSEVVHPIERGAGALIETRQQQIRLIWLLREAVCLVKVLRP